MKTGLLFILLAVTSGVSNAGTFPIRNGRLISNLDGGGFLISNVTVELPATNGYVPYTGATTNLDLGTNALFSKWVNIPSGGNLTMDNARIDDDGVGYFYQLESFAVTNLNFLSFSPAEPSWETIVESPEAGTLAVSTNGGAQHLVILDTDLNYLGSITNVIDGGSITVIRNGRTIEIFGDPFTSDSVALAGGVLETNATYTQTVAKAAGATLDIANHVTNETSHPGRFDPSGAASTATGTLASALRSEIVTATGGVYSASIAATTSATGALGTATRSYADAAVTAGTGTLAGVLRGETTAATGAVYGAAIAAIGVATQGMLTAESDPILTAWRTNAAPGSTNAILPSGALVDIAALLGGGASDGGATNIAAGAADGYDAGTRTLTWDTNAAVGAAGCLTNAAAFDAAGSAAAVSNAAFGQGWITAGDIPAETDPIALLPDGSRAMTGNLNMGGQSITNIATNSLTFANGTSLSSPSNGTLAVSGAEVYTTANPPPASGGSDYVFDPIYLRTTGSRVTLAEWLPNMVLANWFETRMRYATSSGGWEDGLSYVFDDQEGILVDRSTNYVWAAPYYNRKSDETAGSGATSNLNVAGFNDVFEGAFDTTATINNPLEVAVPWSVSFWARSYSNADWNASPGAGGPPMAFSQYSDNIDIGWYGCYWALYDGAWHSSSEFGYSNIWQHIAAGKKADGSVWIAVNGVIKLENDASGGNDALTGETTIGAWWSPSGYPPRGDLSQLAVWSNTLLQAQLTAFAAGAPVDTNDVNLVMYFPLDEGSGETLTATVGAFAAPVGTNFVWKTGTFPVYDTGGVVTIKYNMSLTATNTLLDYTASNALWRAVISLTNASVTTNGMRGYIVNLDTGVTNWAPGIALESTTDLSNRMWGASITNLALGTNLAAGVWVSSNVSATVKGLGAIYAP